MSSKWLAVLLVVSLGVNLALAGFMLGRQTGPYRAFDPTLHYPRWARSLPEERRADLRPILRDHFRAARPKIRDMRAQHRAMHEAIVAQPFDRQALQDALAGLRAGYLRGQEQSHASFLAFVEQLTPEERAALARDLQRAVRPRRPPGDRPDR